MAPELKAYKRKASVPASEAGVKNVKKTSADAEGIKKKRKAADDIAAKPVKKSKADATAEPFIKIVPKRTADKKEKSAVAAAKEKKSKKLIEKKIIQSESDEEVNEEAAENSDEEEEEVDDQTAALLAGFDSEEEDPKPQDGEGFKAGEDVGKISKKAKKQALAAQKKASEADEPGTVYLGHIPHGFYEHEIKSYFSQFGEITRYRVSRNPKTGRSKHYAFIEFKSSEVADIVAKTMDNYLLFGHILKCKLLAPGQAHADLWKGANKRFKAVPWNKIAGRKLKQGMDEAGWEKRNENEEERRAEKAEKLKEIGYEFNAPKLKSAKDVPKTKREEPAAAIEAAIDAEAEAEVKAIEAAVESTPVPAEEENSKKSKKSKKGKAEASTVVETVQSSDKMDFVMEAPEAESSKGKKNKSKKAEKIVTVEEEIVETPAIEEVVAPSASEKPKKSKKSKVVEKKVEEAVVDTENPSTSLKSKKSKTSLVTKTEEIEAEKPTPILKSKKSKENLSEAVPVKAKKVKKQKSSASLV